MLAFDWAGSTVLLLVAFRWLQGIEAEGFGSMLLAGVLAGFVNGALAGALRTLEAPPSVLLLAGLSLLVNITVLKSEAWLVPGFRIRGLAPAVRASVLLAAFNLALRRLPF